MKKVFKKIISGIQLFANHFQDRQYMSWALKHRHKLVQFEKKHAGEKCFIIGNGPSLNKMDLTQLKDCICFGLNKIYLHPQIEQIQIDYHVTVNPLVISQSLDQFNKLNCPSFVSYRACDGAIPPLPNIFYLLTTGGPQRFSFNPYDTISEGATVTYVALQLAHFMGFTEVYLIGVDHYFVAQGEPNEKQLMKGPDINHFHPDYFSGQEWHLPDLEASEIAYRLAQYYFSRFGRHVFDATVDGKLDVFEKIDYDSALSRCRKT